MAQVPGRRALARRRSPWFAGPVDDESELGGAAVEVLEARYLRRDPEGHLAETPGELVDPPVKVPPAIAEPARRALEAMVAIFL
jgi:hypothetical protein